MDEKQLCGNCPIASVKRIKGNGITEPEARTAIKCPFNPEFPRNPLNICSHLRSREKAGYKFDSGTVARLLDLCRTHDVAVQMEYRRPSDGYLITVSNGKKSLRILISSERLDNSTSPNGLVDEEIGTAIGNIVSEVQH